MQARTIFRFLFGTLFFLLSLFVFASLFSASAYISKELIFYKSGAWILDYFNYSGYYWGLFFLFFSIILFLNLKKEFTYALLLTLIPYVQTLAFMKITLKNIYFYPPLKTYIESSNKVVLISIILIFSTAVELFLIARYYLIASLDKEATNSFPFNFNKSNKRAEKKTKPTSILTGMKGLDKFKRERRDEVESEIERDETNETVIDLSLSKNNNDDLTSILENSSKILDSLEDGFETEDKQNTIEDELNQFHDLYEDAALDHISSIEDDEYDSYEDYEGEEDCEDEIELNLDSNIVEDEVLPKTKALEQKVVEAKTVETGSVEKKVAEKRPASRKPRRYDIPTAEVLTEYSNSASWLVDEETKASGEILRATLEEFKIAAEVTGIRKGPVITMFEVLPAPGVKLSKIVNLADNIALRLAASRVRIVAPIPGKHAVGIEIPNKERSLVSFKEIAEDEKFVNSKNEIPVILGKDISGDANIIDLTQTPHLLIAGATGSGKSVCVNSLITSILYKKNPNEVKMILIDPKIVELKLYNDIPHLLTPVITEPKKAYQALQYCLAEMERRYSLLDSLGVRDIKSFNRRIDTKNIATEKLPYIVVVIDEFADLMATTGKELEATIARLAAMSRAVGIHLVLATQRPSVDVITGIIKANIPSRIAFMVASKFDSRIIIDSVGAEKLLGRGDMLFAPAWDATPTRIQGSFLSEDEVENVVEHVKTFGEPDYIDDEIFIEDEDDFGVFGDSEEEDPLMQRALEIITSTGKASASFLQRRLKIGYNRAARMIEIMEHRGIVGPQNGSKPRDVLVSADEI